MIKPLIYPKQMPSMQGSLLLHKLVHNCVTRYITFHNFKYCLWTCGVGKIILCHRREREGKKREILSNYINKAMQKMLR